MDNDARQQTSCAPEEPAEQQTIEGAEDHLDGVQVYNEYKENLYNYAETRDIYYIDQVIEPSQADRAALLEEVNEITTQLEGLTDDYASFVRRSGSYVTYSEVIQSAKTRLGADCIELLHLWLQRL